MKNKLYLNGSVLIIIAAILWAFDGLLRRSLYSLPAISIVFLEHAVALIILLPLLLDSLRSFLSLRRTDKLLMMWIALASSVLGTLWFTKALLASAFLPLSVVFLLQKLQPVFVIFASVFFLKEKFSKKSWTWTVLALVAAYFVTFPGGRIDFTSGGGTVTAALYALLAAIAWGSSTVFSRMMLAKLPDTHVTTLRFFFATIFSALLLLQMGHATSLRAVTADQLGRVLLIACTTGLFALFVYYKGLARVRASHATILELVFPLTAMVLDFFVYKQVLHWSQYVAGFFLLLSVTKIALQQKIHKSCRTKAITGKGRGKFLGYPTINMTIPMDLDMQDGIYAVRVRFAGKKYQGAAHLGPVPTYAQNERSFEVFLLDVKHLTHAQVDGKTLTVEFIEWLRPVYTFASKEALVAQISLDVAKVRQVLA